MLDKKEFEKLIPFFGKAEVERVYSYYLEANESERKIIEYKLPLVLKDKAGTGIGKDFTLMLPPTETASKGDIFLGKIKYAGKDFHQFYLAKRELASHVLIAGDTGSGKTNLVLVLIEGLLKHKIPFWIFDWKRTFRKIVSVSDREIICFTVGAKLVPFYFNFLIPPPNVEVNQWLPIVVDVFCDVYELQLPSRVALGSALKELYRDCGYGKANVYIPTLSDLERILTKSQTKNNRKQSEAVLARIAAINLGAFGSVVNSRKYLNPSKLLKTSIVFELYLGSSLDKNAFVTLISTWLYYYRLANKETRELHVNIYDEAHNTFLRRGAKHGAEPITDIMLREARELKEAYVLSDQFPSKLSHTAFGVNTKVFLNLGHIQDIEVACGSLLLDSDEKTQLSKLPIGEGFIKVKSRYSRAFHLRFPLSLLGFFNCSDKKLKEKAKGWFSLLQDIGEYGKSLEPGSRQDIDSDESILLNRIYENQLTPISAVYKLSGFNRRKGVRLRNRLLEKGCIHEVEIRYPKGRIKLYELTRVGVHALQTATGGDITESCREGGVEHRFWKRYLKQHLESKGFRVKEEHKGVDLIAEKDNKAYAIEIETGKSNCQANIQKCLRLGFDKVFVVATTAQAFTKLSSLPEIQAKQAVLILASKALSQLGL